MTRPRPRLAALAGAALVTVIAAGCTQANPHPGITPMTTGSPAASALRTGSTTSHDPPTSTPAPTSLTAEEQAYAKAETAYRAWVANYAKAEAAGFDASKLDTRLATPALLDLIKMKFKQFRGDGGSGLYTTQFVDIRGTRYVPGKEVQLQVCAITNAQFIDKNGKDVTVTADGKPSPPNKNPWVVQVQMRSTDNGKTWKSDTIVYPDPKDPTGC